MKQTKQKAAMWRALLALTLPPALSACAHSYDGRLNLNPAREYAAADYDDVYARWTRSAEVYEQLQSQAFIAATLRSADFRRAFVAAYARIMDIPAQERERLWAGESAGAASHIEFAVVMYTTERKWNDLDTRDSVWRVRLVAGESGAEVPPSEVISVKELSPQMQKLYPAHTPFTRFYFVRFPSRSASGQGVIPAAGGPLSLRLTSGLGKASLTWDVGP